MIVHSLSNYGLLLRNTGGLDGVPPHFARPSSPPPPATRVEVALGRRLGARSRWRTRRKTAVNAALQRGRCLTAPNCSILEPEGVRLSAGEKIKLRLRQTTPRTDHLFHSWFRGGR